MSDDYHVYPLNDLVEHETEGDSCVCGPRCEILQTERGDAHIYVHHSLDGREAAETPTGKEGDWDARS